ncbi:hypothetical protein VTH06DRAFT_6178 [Thermothelomyces fergusii]
MLRGSAQRYANPGTDLNILAQVWKLLLPRQRGVLRTPSRTTTTTTTTTHTRHGPMTGAPCPIPTRTPPPSSASSHPQMSATQLKIGSAFCTRGTSMSVHTKYGRPRCVSLSGEQLPTLASAGIAHGISNPNWTLLQSTATQLDSPAAAAGNHVSN